MEDTLSILKQFWIVWTFLLFVGIVAWAYWPSRKQEMEDHGRIPFRDEETKNGHQG